jgi:hypothetical protein
VESYQRSIPGAARAGAGCPVENLLASSPYGATHSRAPRRSRTTGAPTATPTPTSGDQEQRKPRPAPASRVHVTIVRSEPGFRASPPALDGGDATGHREPATGNGQPTRERPEGTRATWFPGRRGSVRSSRRRPRSPRDRSPRSAMSRPRRISRCPLPVAGSLYPVDLPMFLIIGVDRQQLPEGLLLTGYSAVRAASFPRTGRPPHNRDVRPR